MIHASKAQSPILLYLPPGPLLPPCEEEQEQVLSALSESTNAAVVRIGYRASSAHTYPGPCHDVLTGYDWIKENLLRDEFDRPRSARLGVCGELMGGSLATMLALTECRHGETGISAAAINNPVADWVFPDDLPYLSPSDLPEPISGDETAVPADQDLGDSAATVSLEDTTITPTPTRKRRKRTTKAPPLTAWQAYGDNTTIPTATLSAERDHLFSDPSSFFDRFASPLHFFRSPHAQLLLPDSDDAFASHIPPSEHLLDPETQMYVAHQRALESASGSFTPVAPTLARCRAYARTYPPAGSNLSLPQWHITAGSQSPLLDQASELAKMLRRSIARQVLKRQAGRVRWIDATEKKQYEAFAEERVKVDFVEGEECGLWTMEAQNGRGQGIDEVGKWMKEILHAT